MDKTITLEDRALLCHITYQKKRKTVQLKLTNSNSLDIVAPLGCQLATIEKIVVQKSKWILSRIAQLTALSAIPVNQHIQDGSAILYQGEIFQLRFSYNNTTPPVYIRGQELVIALPDQSISPEYIAGQLRKWYVHTAAQHLAHRTSYWSANLKVCPKRISIKDQKTRWGSCSSSGTVSYNWRILMAPPSVMDYLVIHELCHFLEPNHSRKFWSLVETFSPTYRQERNWLKKNGPLLSRIL